MEPLSLADELTLEPAAASADEVVCPGVEGRTSPRGARGVPRATGWDAPPVRLTIDKRIPVAAGMGGGSADAAAALRLAAAAAGPRRRALLDGSRRASAPTSPRHVAPALLVGGAGTAAPPARSRAPSASSSSRARTALARRRLPRGRPPRPRRDADELDRLGGAVGGAAHARRCRRGLLVNDLEAAARSLCPRSTARWPPRGRPAPTTRWSRARARRSSGSSRPGRAANAQAAARAARAPPGAVEAAPVIRESGRRGGLSDAARRRGRAPRRKRKPADGTAGCGAAARRYALGWRRGAGRVELVLLAVGAVALGLYGAGRGTLPNIEKLLEDIGGRSAVDLPARRRARVPGDRRVRRAGRAGRDPDVSAASSPARARSRSGS